MHKQPLRLPISLVILDGVGTLLLGLGLAEWLLETNLMPAALQFEHYPLLLVTTGALFMLPLIGHILKQALGLGPREI